MTDDELDRIKLEAAAPTDIAFLLAEVERLEHAGMAR